MSLPDEFEAETQEIGAYEAKTKLPQLLRQVMKGHRFTITNRGQPVAELIPVDADKKNRHRAATDAMIALMQSAPQRVGEGVSTTQIREWRDEDRK